MYIYSLEGVNVHLRKYTFSPVAIVQTAPCAVQFALCSFHVSRWRSAVCTRRGANCTASFLRLLNFMLFCVCCGVVLCCLWCLFSSFAYRCPHVHMLLLFVFVVCLGVFVCLSCLLAIVFLRSMSTFVSLCLVVCFFFALYMMFFIVLSLLASMAFVDCCLFVGLLLVVVLVAAVACIVPSTQSCCITRNSNHTNISYAYTYIIVYIYIYIWVDPRECQTWFVYIETQGTMNLLDSEMHEQKQEQSWWNAWTKARTKLVKCMNKSKNKTLVKCTNNSVNDWICQTHSTSAAAVCFRCDMWKPKTICLFQKTKRCDFLNQNCSWVHHVYIYI